MKIRYWDGRSRRFAAVESHISRKTSEILDFLYAASQKVACAAFCEESRIKFVGPNKPHRKSGDVGHPAFVADVAKTVVGLRPVFFGPRTLVRTWGTRPVPNLFCFRAPWLPGSP
jgi:hypothetical protein